MKSLIHAIALCVALSPALRADDPKHPEIDAKTAEVMKKLGPLYKNAKSMQADAVIVTTMKGEGDEKREMKVKATIAFERPNKFSLRSKHENDPNAGLDVICDGKTVLTSGKRLKQHIEGKAPADLSEIGMMILPYGANATGMLFQNVLAEDPAEMLLDGISEGKHAGMEKVNGKETHHLKFKQNQFDWAIWVAAEGEPFILKASQNIKGRGGERETVETYSNWKVNPELAKDTFEVKIPEGSKKVNRLGGDDGDGR